MKTSKQGIKALAFDAYGTLFDVHSVISVCSELFPDHGEALSRTWRAKQLEYTWLRSLMGRYEDFWQVTEDALVFACQALNLPLEPPARARLMEAYLHLEAYPEVPAALKALSNHPLAILSNGSPRMLKAAVESAGLEGTFAYLISADEARIYKPSPLVYQLVPQKMSVEAASIAFVSANPFDVVGGKAFGFWTFWVNRLDNPWNEPGFPPDVTVKRLTDLTEAVKQ